MDAKLILIAALIVITLFYFATWYTTAKRKREAGEHGHHEPLMPTPLQLAIGFVTNFFDTLGIGSYATTTAMFRAWKIVPDELIPGTLNVGHVAANGHPGHHLHADRRSGLHDDGAAHRGGVRRLLARAQASSRGSRGAACRSAWASRSSAPPPSCCCSWSAPCPEGAPRWRSAAPSWRSAFAGNFVLGALMTLGIGLYAPCMIMISLLGMNPTAAFPIMMGSCAFLMPVGSLQFVRKNRYHLRAALGLALGGPLAVLIAAFIVKSLPLLYVRWLVVVVVVYTASTMLQAAARERREAGARGRMTQPA